MNTSRVCHRRIDCRKRGLFCGCPLHHRRLCRRFLRMLFGDRGRLGNRADRRSGRRAGGRSNLARYGQLPLPDDVSPHPLPFRSHGGAGDGASARGRGTTVNPRCGGGGRGRIGGRGALDDHWRLWDAIGASAAAELAGARRGEEIEGGGGAESVGVAR
jgi:hypothetical protein